MYKKAQFTEGVCVWEGLFKGYVTPCSVANKSKNCGDFSYRRKSCKCEKTRVKLRQRKDKSECEYLSANNGNKLQKYDSKGSTK